MNFECSECSKRNVQVFFRSLDDLQDHLFKNHLVGTSSPNAKTLTNPSATANESVNDFLKRIITTVESKGQQSEFVQHCSIGSATSAQSNVKTEPEDVNTSKREILGTVETKKRKAVPKPFEHISQRNEEILESVEIRKQKSAPVHNQQKASPKSVEHVSRRSEGKARQNAKVEGESSCLRQMEQAKRNLMSLEPKPGPSQVTTTRAITSPAAIWTDKIRIAGPCLYPRKMFPRRSHINEIRAYFSQFGKIVGIDLKRIQGDMTTDATLTFDNCDSAAKCIQQRKHIIHGRDFIVWAESPTKSMKRKMRAELEQSMPGATSENVSTQNDRRIVGESAESNIGNQLLQGTNRDPGF